MKYVFFLMYSAFSIYALFRSLLLLGSSLCIFEKIHRLKRCMDIFVVHTLFYVCNLIAKIHQNFLKLIHSNFFGFVSTGLFLNSSLRLSNQSSRIKEHMKAPKEIENTQRVPQGKQIPIYFIEKMSDPLDRFSSTYHIKNGPN